MVSEASSPPRARPLSGGLWTLFSWLRRDERASSSDSLSSAGSARTAASFAFLPPTYYHSPNPLVLPPPGPPTDSYKKRLKDRNLRRHHERDLTLHRKYGLHWGEEGGGYSASSLPVRAGGCGRERRAASEGRPRRAPHVPGKRPAPPPPGLRARPRKRRAPQPPGNNNEHSKENFKTIQLHSINIPKSMNESQTVPDGEISHECKSEKYKKRDVIPKDTKVKSDKSFLKQFFDNRKRNSAIDTSSVKILPSISELDKQAAEIIESCKQRAMERDSMSSIEHKQSISHSHSASSKGEAWFCTRCLRKYNLSIKACLYCLPDEQKVPIGLQKHLDNNKITTGNAANTSTQTENSSNATSLNRVMDEKQKLKVMLKEMKDSLPKRPKHENNDKRLHTNLETPTLRIGSSVMTENLADTRPSSAQTVLTREGAKYEKVPSASTALSFTKSVTVTQPVVLTHVVTDLGGAKQRDKRKINMENQKHAAVSSSMINKKENETDPTNTQNQNSKLHTPLKISSLLNPVYIPISYTSGKQQSNTMKSPENISINTDITISNVLNKEYPNLKITEKQPLPKVDPVNTSVASISLSSRPLNKDNTSNSYSPPSINACLETNKKPESTDIVERLDQHARRRDLVNQLEKSIAGGDERAAAEAAVKLAQLRLSCSVLSFSSQIVTEPSSSSSIIVQNKTEATKQQRTEIKEPATTKSNEQHTLSTVETSASEKNIDSKTAPSLRSNPKPEVTVEEANHYDQTKPSTSKQVSQVIKDDMVTIAVWIEDKEAARGPVNLRIQRQANMGELRRQAETSLGLDARLQRWIVGRALCTHDNTPLASLAGPDFSAPFYLCLVESDTKAESTVPLKQDIEDTDNNLIDKAGRVYSELMKLEQQAVVPNTEPFECDVCMEKCAPNGGVVLRECVHTFCNDCLSDVIRHSEEPVVTCPAPACIGVLQEREIRALVSQEDYERWLARSLAAAESGTRNAFHCRTRDCTGWALCEPGVRQFPCPVCKRTNCVLCQAIHEGETCDQYRAKLEEAAKASDSNATDASTRALLDTLIRKGEALECPECSAIITKKWGCDWVKCSACKTEICWVTRGRRWGPGGRGDTSAGCRCGLDGKRCHPSCGYCH